MGNTRRKPTPEPPRRRGRPAMTIEERENQLVVIAMDETERQMREGTASAQQITHFLKIGSTTHQLEKEKLRRENELLLARVEQLETGKNVERLYEEALRSMRSYQGQEVDELDEGYYDG